MKQQMQRSDLAIHDVSLYKSNGTGEMEAFFRHRGLDREPSSLASSLAGTLLFVPCFSLKSVIALEAGGPARP